MAENTSVVGCEPQIFISRSIRERAQFHILFHAHSKFYHAQQHSNVESHFRLLTTVYSIKLSKTENCSSDINIDVKRSGPTPYNNQMFSAPYFYHSNHSTSAIFRRIVLPLVLIVLYFQTDSMKLAANKNMDSEMKFYDRRHFLLRQKEYLDSSYATINLT